jgi:hypothetical protein
MKRFVYYSVVGVIVAICYLLANSLSGILAASALPVAQETLHKQKIYAYREWQSVGVQVHVGERVQIQAEGEWLYTPGEYHGPAGHPRYPAPSFYPVSGVAGGVLIGKIGENGTPFVVGRNNWGLTAANWSSSSRGQEEGLLYLRINDDILSDNRGSVVVEVTVTPASER